MRRMAHDDLLRRGCGLAQALILAFERLRSILLVETEKSSWTLVQRCPLWVKSRHMRCNKPCLLYTRKRHWMRSFRRPLRANRGHSASGGRSAGNRIGHEAVGCARPAGRAGARTTSGTLHAPFDVGAAPQRTCCLRKRPPPHDSVLRLIRELDDFRETLGRSELQFRGLALAEERPAVADQLGIDRDIEHVD
jgi:hypothetical protein